MPNPQNRDGNRNMDCDKYSVCLGIAAKKNWRGFNCESCDESKRADEEKSMPTSHSLTHNLLCEDCGKRPPLGKGKLCPSCMAKRLNAKRKNASQAPSGKTNSKSRTEQRGPNVVPISSPASSMEIIFKGHPELLERMKYSADEETRPLEYQVLHACKVYLEHKTRSCNVVGRAVES
jgi:hypothetical protein